MQATISVDEFWRYSLQYYDLGKNKASLLWLQDEAGINVNCVLFLMYLQTKGLFVSFNKFKRLQTSIKNLDSLTSNFRVKRRMLKSHNIAQSISHFRTPEYRKLLEQELELERKQQAYLVSVFSQLPLTKSKLNTNSAKVKIDINEYINKLIRISDEQVLLAAGTLIEGLIKEQQSLEKIFGRSQDE